MTRTLRSQELARRVIKYYLEHSCAAAETVRFFVAQGEPKRTIYAIIKRYKDEGQVEYSKNRGGVTKCLPALVELIEQRCINDPEISVTDLADFYKCSRGTAYNAKKRVKAKSFLAQPAPSWNDNQIERCKRSAANILNRTAPKYGNKIIIMDDETYVYADPRERPGRKWYTKVGDREVADKHKFKKQNNFAKKFLVWQALSSDGLSSPPFITEGTINGDVYTEILRDVLLPWIKQNYSLDDVLFWPDLATAHCRLDVVRFIIKNHLDFVCKKENGPKMVTARPIERYWALCKRAYRKLQVIPESVEEFAEMWRETSAQVAENCGKNIFGRLRERLRLVRKNGPRSPLTDLNR